MSEQRFAERRRAGTWHRYRRWLIAIGVLVLAGLLVWAIWFSSVLGVRSVKVVGLETIKSGQVTGLAAIVPGTALARLDTAGIAARVASLERVESVNVSRSWPNTVTIDVIERHAVAWINVGGTIRGLDRFGIEFRSYSSPPKGLFEIRVSALTIANRQDSLVEASRVIGIIKARDPGLYGSIDHVNVATKDSVELALSHNRVVRWGSAARSAEKLAVLTPLLRIRARTYDVTAPEQPTTKQ